MAHYKTFLSLVMGCVLSHHTQLFAQYVGITYVTGTDVGSVSNAISAQCTTGGTVVMPASVTFSSPLNFKCPNSATPNRVTLKGAPTKITCSTGALPCIDIGDFGGTANYRPGLGFEDIDLVGPGASVTGSIGLELLPLSGQTVLKNVRVDNFDTGVHVYGQTGTSGLLWSAYFSDLVVGFGSGNSGASQNTVNVAVHLEGPVANIRFKGFELSGTKREILADGAAGSGAGATFSNGSFNRTTVPGTAAVSVSSSDAAVRELILDNIEDWEGACPALEVGQHARVVVSNVAFTGDTQNSTGQPFFRILPSTVSWLRISNANLIACAGGAPTIKVESSTALMTVTGSDIYGPINFTVGGYGAITGNRCSTAGQPSGVLTAVRSAGNLGCADH